MAETKKKKVNTKVSEKTKKVTTQKKKTSTKSIPKKNKQTEKLAFRKSENFILGISIVGLLCMCISNMLGIIITLAAFALSVSELKRSTLKITIAFILTATACIFFVVTYTNDDINNELKETDISSICKEEEVIYEENAKLLINESLLFEDNITTVTKTDLENYLLDNFNDKCDGYVEVYKDENDTIVYDAYVKCKKNKNSCQTEGYTE